jgi:hypothetical protein
MSLKIFYIWLIMTSPPLGFKKLHLIARLGMSSSRLLAHTSKNRMGILKVPHRIGSV